MNTLPRFARGLAAAAIFAATTATAPAALIHRYSFNDGTARDSIGKVDGRLRGPGARVAGGKLELRNETSAAGDAISCLEFAGSVLPAAGPSATLVVWFTAKDIGTFARVINFGDSEGTEGIKFIYFSPNAADGQARAAITGSDVGSKTFIDLPPLDDGQPHMVAIVIDGAAKKLRVFVDGREPAPAADLGENTLDKVRPVQNWLGRSSFAADPGLTGAIDELRVYDHALSAAEIAAARDAGPDKLPAK